MAHGHENYKELLFRLARTDFKLRYQGSILGYVWAILKPLLLFAIMNFVFSSIFNFKNSGTPLYSLELLTGLLMFNFFAEGTIAGITSLLSKAQLVTKIFVPRWIIVVSSTLNALFIFGANLIVLSFFFVLYHKMPSVIGVLMFIFYIVCFYILIVSVSLLLSPLFVRFRDINMIWEVVLSVCMYASPIVYPLSMLPSNIHQILLINPVAFIIHFGKQGLIFNHFADLYQILIFLAVVGGFFMISVFSFKKNERKVAEYI